MTISLCQSGAGRATIVKIALLGLIVPQLLISLALDVHSVSVAEALRLNADSLPAGAGYLDLIGPGLTYASGLGLGASLEFFFILTTYFALTHACVERWRGGDVTSAGAALGFGMKKALRSLIPICVLMMFLGTVGQVLTAMSMLVAAMVLTAPAIMLVERKGVFKGLADAALCRYIRRSGFGLWTVLLTLLTFAAVAYTLLFTIAYGREFLLDLNHWLPVPAAVHQLLYATHPLSPLYAVVSVLETLCVSGVFAALPMVIAAAYLTVVGSKTNQQTLGSA